MELFEFWGEKTKERNEFRWIVWKSNRIQVEYIYGRKV